MPSFKNKNKNNSTNTSTKPKYHAEKLFGVTEVVDAAVEKLGENFKDIPIHKYYTGDLKLEFNSVQGRYVTVTKDLPTGTVVFNQTPYSGVVDDQFLSSVCSSCFTACYGSAIRCADCKTNHYCSSKCMRTDLPVHQLECATLAKLPTIGYEGNTSTLRCIIRAIYLSHMEKQYLADQVKKPSQRNKALLQWKPQTGASWADIANLIDHEEKIDGGSKQAVMAVMKAVGSVMSPDAWDPLTAVVAMRLYFIMQVNAHRIQDSAKNLVGLGLYAAVSYANHSCDPSCVVHFGHNGALVMRTLRPLRKGEEVTYSYLNLYEPSFMRREKLIGRYYFDPQLEGRYLPATRVKEDAALAGLRCCACGSGALDYASVKHALLPAQIEVQVVLRDEQGNIVQPEGDDKPAEAQPEIDVVAAPEDVPEAASAAERSTVVRCAGCSAAYSTEQVDRFLGHVDAYLQHALAHVAHSQLDRAREMLEDHVVALTTASKDRTDASSVRAATQDYSKPVPAELLGQPPSASLFKLPPFHFALLNAYFGLIQLGRLLNDFKLLQKYGQLASMCIAKVQGLDRHPEHADALLAAGDSYAYLAGKTGLLELTSTRPIDFVIVDAATEKQMVAHALAAYQQALKIREVCFGPKHALTAQASKRVNAFRKL